MRLGYSTVSVFLKKQYSSLAASITSFILKTKQYRWSTSEKLTGDFNLGVMSQQSDVFLKKQVSCSLF